MAKKKPKQPTKPKVKQEEIVMDGLGIPFEDLMKNLLNIKPLDGDLNRDKNSK